MPATTANGVVIVGVLVALAWLAEAWQVLRQRRLSWRMLALVPLSATLVGILFLHHRQAASPRVLSALVALGALALAVIVEELWHP